MVSDPLRSEARSLTGLRVLRHRWGAARYRNAQVALLGTHPSLRYVKSTSRTTRSSLSTNRTTHGVRCSARPSGCPNVLTAAIAALAPTSCAVATQVAWLRQRCDKHIAIVDVVTKARHHSTPV